MTGLRSILAPAMGLWLLTGVEPGAAQSLEISQITPLPPRKPDAANESGPQFKPAPGVEAVATTDAGEEAATPSGAENATAGGAANATSPATIETAPLDQLQPLEPNDAGSASAEAESAGESDQVATVPSGGTVEAEADDGQERFLKAPFSTPDPMRIERPIAPLPTTSGHSGVVRELDKFSGITKDVEIAVGSEAMVDRLRIRLDGCQAPAANSSQGTMAFLEIWDTKNDTPDPVFHGWMFAESPALSAMDHPRYDVWLITCSAREGEASTASE